MYGHKEKRKAKTMIAIWVVDSDDDTNDFDNETSKLQKINFALMVIMEDISSGIDVETIIAIKNIIDPIIIELLCKIVESKKPKT
jgi:hypothetical protein